MPKNNPPDRIPPPPRPTPDTSTPPPPARIFVELINIDAGVLRDCELGETVAISRVRGTIVVNILSGIRLGEVAPDDYPKVPQATKSGSIVSIDKEKIRCFVEV